MRRCRMASFGLVVALAGTAVLPAGCAGGDEKGAGPAATMIAPGRPGEPNRTVTTVPSAAARPSAADVRFVQMMIPHHRQAVEMSVPAVRQARDGRVKALADRIDKGQTVEISAMQGWLQRHGLDESTGAAGGHGGHGGMAGHGGSGAPAGSGAAGDHASMPGMATPEQMTRLRAATGAEFDRLYLSLMIAHHEGALTMAREALANATDVDVLTIAREVLSSQNAEINRMRDLAA